MPPKSEGDRLNSDGVSASGSAGHLDVENESVSVHPSSGAEIGVSQLQLPENSDLVREGCVQECRTEYKVNELVWGKVSGHPWWPGQIFEPSAASKKAKKYSKREYYLIAYFGDHTFAWNDASHIKPFRSHFIQMESQSYSESFCQALDCALDEVSRRVEFGLSCPCLPNEVLTKIKTQTVANRGIRRESFTREASDDVSTVAAFSPKVLIQRLKSFATRSDGGVNRLVFVVAKAQLLAFNRWRGSGELPSMIECGDLFENDDDIQEPAISEETAKESKLHSEDSRCMRKRAKVDKIEKKNLSGSEKRKARYQIEVKETKKMKKHDGGNTQPTKPLGTGGSNAVSNTPTELPPLKEMLSKLSLAAKDPLNGYNLLESCSAFFFDFRGSYLRYNDLKEEENYPPDIVGGEAEESEEPSGHIVMEGESNAASKTPTELSPLKEMLSKLTLVAKDPLNGYNMLESCGTFFFDLRDSDLKNDDLKGEESEAPSGHIVMEDESDEHQPGIVEGEAEESEEPSGHVVMEHEFYEDLPDIAEVEAEEPYEHIVIDGDSDEDLPVGVEGGTEESTPTSLILNFQDPDAVPLGDELNKMFRRFGPLDESLTEGRGNKSKSARVVFKRQSDAEYAFGDAANFSALGPSLISYRLHYVLKGK